MAADKKEKEKKKSKTPFSVKFAVFVVLMSSIIFFPSTILFCGGMLPTLVAALVDDRPRKTAWVTVGAMNLAGVLPTLIKLWQTGHSLTASLELLMDASTLALAYGGAAVGWFIYNQVPLMVSGIMARKSDRRLTEIEKRQKELVRKWGNEVAGAPPQLPQGR